MRHRRAQPEHGFDEHCEQLAALAVDAAARRGSDTAAADRLLDAAHGEGVALQIARNALLQGGEVSGLQRRAAQLLELALERGPWSWDSEPQG